MSDQTASHIYIDPGTYYPQATCGGYTATFAPGVNVAPALPAPANVAAAATGPESIEVTWDAVDGADSYAVTYWPATDPEATTSVTSTTASATISGLTPSTEYGITVRAVDATGAEGADSAPTTATTPGDQLAAPTGLAVVDITDTTATATWDGVAGAETYIVEWALSADPDTPVGSESVSTTTYEMTGLTANGDYVVSVIAQANGASDSDPATAPFATTAQLATPANLAAAGTTDTSTGLSWDAVDGADGYTVSWATAAEPDTPLGTDNTTAPEYTVTGLSSGTDYVASVVATDSTDAAGASDPATAPFTTLDQLETPANVAATNLAAASADLGWDAVPGADGYTVEWALSADPGTPIGTDTTATAEYTITDLTAETDYTASVTATDSTGAAVDSEPGTTTFTTTA